MSEVEEAQEVEHAERSEKAEQKVERREIVERIVGAWLGVSASNRNYIKETNDRIKALHAEADQLRKDIQMTIEASTETWDGAMSDLRLPVKDGSVVPWTKRLSWDELILALGEDEWLVIQPKGNSSEWHHYGPEDENGRRSCYDCGITVVIPKVDIAVVPPDVPAHITAALEAMEALNR